MRFSSKIEKIECSEVSKLTQIVSENNWTDVITMAGGEPQYKPYEVCINKLEDSLLAGYNKYPPFGGYKSLLKKINTKLFDKNNILVNDKEIYIVPGGASAIYTSLLTVLDDGDEVLIQDPCWEHYPNIIRLAGGVPKQFNMIEEENHYSFDWVHLEQCITDRTKVILINTPLNPCGSIINNKEAEKLIEIAKKYDLIIISDEEYEDFVYTKNEWISPASISTNVITLHSFSKGFALTGIRLAYLSGPREFIDRLHKTSLYSFMFPSSISQYIVEQVLSNDYKSYLEKYRKYMMERMLFIYKGISEIEGLKCRMPEAGLYLFISVNELGISGYEFSQRLLYNQHLLTVPGEGSGNQGQGKIRVFIGLEFEILSEAIKRIKEEVNQIRLENGNGKK